MPNTNATAPTQATKTQITKQTTGPTQLQDLSQKILTGTQRAIRIITKEMMLLITVAQFSRLLVTGEINCQLPASFSQRTCSGRKNQSANSIYREASKFICNFKL
jgi:hypothetical protein